jgi:hypothetical protein
MNGIWVFVGAALIAAVIVLGGRYEVAAGLVSATEGPHAWKIDRITGRIWFCKDFRQPGVAIICHPVDQVP